MFHTKKCLESFCCKKSPNQEIGLRRFSEYRTSEGSEWYQIDPRWLRGHSCLDTGHFFNTSLIQGLVFKGIVKGQESKVWAFFKGLRSFRGPQKQNWKNDQNSIIFGAKIKVRINFIWEKLMEFLLLNEVLKNWIFFQLPIQKSDFITLILSKFSILNANLWSIYSKRFEFMVYTCFCAFWKIKIFWLLRPSKSSGALKKVPAFGFLTFEYAFKN